MCWVWCVCLLLDWWFGVVEDFGLGGVCGVCFSVVGEICNNNGIVCVWSWCCVCECIVRWVFFNELGCVGW